MKVSIVDVNDPANSDEMVCNNRDELMLLLISQASFHDNHHKMFKQPPEFYNHVKNEMSDLDILKELDYDYGEFLDRRGTSFKDMIALLENKTVTVEDRIFDNTQFIYSIV